MKTAKANFSRPDVALPIVVSEDTLFHDCNFSQASPHTTVFDVKPGVSVVFEDCTGINATAPDGAVVRGGNWRHIVRVPLVGQVKPSTNLLCECVRCCTYTAELQDRLAAGTCPKDEKGRVIHSDLKGAARTRRGDAVKLAADRTRSANDNAAAMARVGGTVTTALRTSVNRGM